MADPGPVGGDGAGFTGDQDAAGGNQHDLVFRRHQLRGQQLAVALAALDRNHPLRAPPVARVFGNRRALAETVFSNDEQLGVVAREVPAIADADLHHSRRYRDGEIGRAHV